MKVVIALGALATLVTHAPAALVCNLDTALADTKTKLASGGQANIMVLGDSLSSARRRAPRTSGGISSPTSG
jgi:phospholipase/lecithinase/hemolysin